MLFEPPSFGRRAFLGLRDILLVPSSPHACAIACKNAQIELKSKPKSGGSGGNATEVMKGERLRKTETTMFMKERASLWICGRKAALNCRVVLLTVLFYFAIRRSYFFVLGHHARAATTPPYHPKRLPGFLPANSRDTPRRRPLSASNWPRSVFGLPISAKMASISHASTTNRRWCSGSKREDWKVAGATEVFVHFCTCSSLLSLFPKKGNLVWLCYCPKM